VTADIVGLAGAMWVIAGITGASGLIAAVRLRETLQHATV
jgi:3-polyprenyl-4-hydroxybenzoate decarboxylase